MKVTMKLLVLATLAYSAFGYHQIHKLSVADAWAEWKEIFSQEFPFEEEVTRYNIFAKHHALVNDFNSQDHGFVLGLNQFAHIHEDEFADFYHGTKPQTTNQGLTFRSNTTDVPSAVDWRTKGLVNAVKNQGQCGSCWAFSTVVSLEGQFAKATGKLPSFSEQDLVDCVKNVPYEGSQCCDGCQGGLMAAAFVYIKASQDGNDDTETSYPYKGVNQQCQFNVKNDVNGGKVINYTQGQGEDQLTQMVAQVGPISVGVDANIAWQLYSGGIYTPKGFAKCSNNPNKMDHGVAVVGYDNDQKYWIIRNSWGATWGEKGYMRLVQGQNACGVANVPAYPVVQKN